MGVIHAEHHHQHDAAQDVLPETRTSRLIQYATMAGNAVMGACQAAAGITEAVSTAVVHGLHDIGDAAGYGIQFWALNARGAAASTVHRARKLSHTVIASSSMLAAAQAGLHIAMGHHAESNTFSRYAVAGSFVLNSLILTAAYTDLRSRRAGHMPQGRDIIEHAKTDVATALLATGAVYAQRYSVYAEQWAAIAGGLWVGWKFRPTETNLRVHKHGGIITLMKSLLARRRERAYIQRWNNFVARGNFDNHLLAAEESRPQTIETKKSRRPWTRMAAFGAAALLAALHFGPGGQAENPVEGAPVFPSNESMSGPDRVRQPVVPTPVMECTGVQTDESMWRIAEERIKEATGRPASIPLTNAVTMVTALANKPTNPDPNIIGTADCIKVPTIASISIMDMAVTSPSSHPGIATGIAEINSFGSVDEVMSAGTPIFDSLQRELGAIQTHNT